MAKDLWESVPQQKPGLVVIPSFAAAVVSNDRNGRAYVLATARELFGRAVYSHKTHEKEREIWSQKVCYTAWINIGLTSLTTVFAIVSAALKPVWAMVLTAVFAAATTGFVLWQSNFDP